MPRRVGGVTSCSLRARRRGRGRRAWVGTRRRGAPAERPARPHSPRLPSRLDSMRLLPARPTASPFSLPPRASLHTHPHRSCCTRTPSDTQNRLPRPARIPRRPHAYARAPSPSMRSSIRFAPAAPPDPPRPSITPCHARSPPHALVCMNVCTATASARPRPIPPPPPRRARYRYPRPSVSVSGSPAHTHTLQSVWVFVVLPGHRLLPPSSSFRVPPRAYMEPPTAALVATAIVHRRNRNRTRTALLLQNIHIHIHYSLSPRSL
ncbi:hypothetical protein C2E23DRAFT_358730 [Lenzites betulinus]|nr:hypothetical protein C2E23DRAFT_358730 [Lenzites betulinus]